MMNADGWEEKETWKMWTFLSFPAPVSLVVSMVSDGHRGGKNFSFLSGQQTAVLAMTAVHHGSDLRTFIVRHQGLKKDIASSALTDMKNAWERCDLREKN